MSFTGDFDIFVCLRENEEEAYTFPFTSPLHFFLIRLPFFSKKNRKKTSFLRSKWLPNYWSNFFGILLLE